MQDHYHVEWGGRTSKMSRAIRHLNSHTSQTTSQASQTPPRQNKCCFPLSLCLSNQYLTVLQGERIWQVPSFYLTDEETKEWTLWIKTCLESIFLWPGQQAKCSGCLLGVPGQDPLSVFSDKSTTTLFSTLNIVLVDVNQSSSSFFGQDVRQVTH